MQSSLEDDIQDEGEPSSSVWRPYKGKETWTQRHTRGNDKGKGGGGWINAYAHRGSPRIMAPGGRGSRQGLLPGVFRERGSVSTSISEFLPPEL